MRILVIGDVHGKYEELQKVISEASGEDFDVIISQGDFTDMFDVPTNFTQMDIADMVVQKLLIPGKPLLCVPGNQDPHDILDVFDEYGAGLHRRKRKAAGVLFVGWGGADTPFNTLFEPSEKETAEALAGMVSEIKENWVLVTHAPPHGTELDLVKPGKHVGSNAIRDVIIKKKPLLAISAHIHENHGIFRLGGTTLFYPGPAYDGYYGIAEITGNKVKCEVRKAAD